MANIKAYYWLTKPGIVYGNLLATAAGFMIAARTSYADLPMFLGVMVSVALVIASACAINNYIDRDIDKVMDRTSWRALAAGTIPPYKALSFAALLGSVGFVTLIAFTNAATFALGLIGFIDYVIFYGWAKRHSVHGTLVGTLSGSAPLAAGYTAVTGSFDGGALLLFIMMACWQMAHFYAIAIRRLKDYKAAKLPVLPAVHGIRATKLQIIAYIAGFMVSDILLYGLGYIDRLSVVVLGIYGAVWLSIAAKGLSVDNNKAWAKKTFMFSLLFLPLLLVLSAVSVWLY